MKTSLYHVKYPGIQAALEKSNLPYYPRHIVRLKAGEEQRLLKALTPGTYFCRGTKWRLPFDSYVVPRWERNSRGDWKYYPIVEGSCHEAELSAGPITPCCGTLTVYEIPGYGWAVMARDLRFDEHGLRDHVLAPAEFIDAMYIFRSEKLAKRIALHAYWRETRGSVAPPFVGLRWHGVPTEDGQRRPMVPSLPSLDAPLYDITLDFDNGVRRAPAPPEAQSGDMFCLQINFSLGEVVTLRGAIP